MLGVVQPYKQKSCFRTIVGLDFRVYREKYVSFSMPIA